MDQYDRYLMQVRSSSVEGDRTNAKRNWVMTTGSRVIKNKPKEESINKLIDEIKMRKDKGMGDGKSLYLRRRYNLQNQGRSAVFTPDNNDRHNQTMIDFNRDESGPLSPRVEIEKQAPADAYDEEKLNAVEDPIMKKVKIPKHWEKDPLTDRNYYMKSPQYRFSVEHGDFDTGRYQSRYMNRRFKQQDSFSKVIPTYLHQQESSYNGNQAQSHRVHKEILKDDLGRDLANMDLRNFKRTDFLQGYADMIWCMPELAPQPRRKILNKAGEPWKMNVMHSMWPINSIYHGKYQSGTGTGNKL